MYTQSTHTQSTHTQPTHTASQLSTWLAWAYRVACQPCVYTQPTLLASAEERIARLEAGTYTQADIQGLEDWAEEFGW